MLPRLPLNIFFVFTLPPIPSPLDTLTRKNLSRGEGVATEWRATEDRRHPEPSKPSNPCGEVLQEAEGAPSILGDSPVFTDDIDPLGPAGAAENADMRTVEPSCVDVHKQGGVLPVVGIALALAKDTVGVGPADEAETASAAKPEALVSWAQDKTRCGREVNAQPHEALPQKGKRNAGALPQKREQRPNEGEREPVRLQGEAPRGDEGALEMPPRTYEHEPDWPPREVSREDTQLTWEASNVGQETRRRRKRVSSKSAHCRKVHKRGRLQAQLSAARAVAQRRPVHLGGSSLWDPGRRLPTGKRIPNSKGPVEAKKNN